MPRRVYWVRRLVLLAVLAVVVGTGYVGIRALADAWSADEPDVATTASAEVAEQPPSSASTPGASGSPSAGPTVPAAGGTSAERRARDRAAERALPEPDGVCPDSDVVVTPRVDGARLGEPIQVVLEISTATTPACTWEVAPDTVFLKVTQETEDSEALVWSSQHCPLLMPTAQVVARQVQPAEVVVSWSGRKSDPECSEVTGWVHAGEFEAVSVARGAVSPREVAFRIRKPAPQVVVEPADPTPAPDGAEEPGTDD